MAAFTPLASGDPEQVGRYRLVGRLGQGGMGRVYLAQSPSGRTVAVKVVRAVLADDPGFRRRFVREVAAARLVKGVFTAAVVDADPEGRPAWLATEYVPGLSLGDALAEYGAWPEHAVRQLGAALAEALGVIHRAGVVHRDLKPSNVLLAADGPRVIDFGISVAAKDTLLTETGVVIGTPGFIPPEQLRGERTGPAADVFALGAVLAYTGSGTGPFGNGAGHAVNYRVMHEKPDLGGLPSALAEVTARCLAKNPEKRPAIPELLKELGQVPGNLPDGRIAQTDWLPGPVAASIARIHAEAARLTFEEKDTLELSPGPAPPVAEPDDAPAAVLPAPGGRNHLTRRRLLAGLAATAVVAVVATTALLDGFGPGQDEKPRSTPKVKQLWSRPLDGGLSLDVVSDGAVYLSSAEQHTVQALNARDGSRLWQRQTTGANTSVMSASGGMLYYASGESLYAAGADNGETRWENKEYRLRFAPVTVDDAAYSNLAGHLLAQDVGTGKLRWTYPLGNGAKDDVAIVGSRVYALADRVLHAVNTGTGTREWTFEAGSALVTAPVVASGTVYAGGRDGTLYAVDTRTGKEVWRQGFDGKLRDPRTADGADAPVVAGGVVYFENDGYVSAFDAGTGKPLWRHRPAADETKMLSVAAGTVYFLDLAAGNLHALDARSGLPKWTENLASRIEWRPYLVDGVVYYEDGDRLRAVSVVN
ncbi:serine/threonine-protein kinase [Streptomyces sp. NBC_01003]|uniref:serine/threonine-protein kinase n=1 Tax=Streptomyces sp. NBC_01003 TaxID=2903714 RepID=UPI00386D7E7F|nr:serine/threonine-protein kinase [Streptomyces sp. NBC_01003]